MRVNHSIPSTFQNTKSDVQRLTPAAWRVCLKRNNMDNDQMALDISNHQYIGSDFLSPSDNVSMQANVSLVPLADDVWNEETHELSLGAGKLQLSIVQPELFCDQASYPKTNNEHFCLPTPEPKTHDVYKPITVQEVLLCR